MARLLWFSLFNALSFEILGGQILVLFARQVGASLMQIGVLASLMPFASTIQLAVAPLVNRFGPKAIMLTGWTARTVVAVFLLVVPAAAARYGPAGATNALLGIIGLFCLFRALGMSSWLPLLQEIVPVGLRGEFVGRLEVLRHVSIIAASLLTALYLLGTRDLGPFLHVLAVGVVTAAVGLAFLSGLPHVPPSNAPVDREFFRTALDPLRSRDFRRYLAFSASLRFAAAALPSFIILFLRDRLHMGPSRVLFLTTIGSVGAALTLLVWGRLVDRHGSKRVLRFGILGMAASTLLWAAIGPGHRWVTAAVAVAALVQGTVGSGLVVAIMQMELGLVPRENREHYVAATITLAGIAAGISPILGGALLHALEDVSWQLGPVAMDAYRVYFLATAGAFLVPLALHRRLPAGKTAD